MSLAPNRAYGYVAKDPVKRCGATCTSHQDERDPSNTYHVSHSDPYAIDTKLVKMLGRFPLLADGFNRGALARIAGEQVENGHAHGHPGLHLV